MTCLTTKIRHQLHLHPEWKSRTIAEVVGCETRRVTEVRSRMVRGYYETRAIQDKVRKLERALSLPEDLIEGDFP